MTARLADGIVVALMVGVLAGAGFAADENDDNEKKKGPFSVKFIDEGGKPIEGATAGLSAHFGNDNTTLAKNEAGWGYVQGTTTNVDGIANFHVEKRNPQRLALVARQPDRRLSAVWKNKSEKRDSATASEMIVITMHPECRVSGRLDCDDLRKRNRDIGWTNVFLKSGGTKAFSCSSREQTFHFFVPPGEYQLSSYGELLHFVDQQFSVKSGQRELDLGTIQLPATRLALLMGQPAPKLEGIACWKNGPAVDLASLRGRCVLLDFWGYWCGPCLYGMPTLFTLHDKYHDQGLEIVGIHVDSGKEENDPVDSVEKLDAKLVKAREGIWNGRDVPYMVGLVTGKQTSFGTAIETDPAMSVISAEYGVVGYPTLILIDRKGNVVKQFNSRLAEDIAILERLLREK